MFRTVTPARLSSFLAYLMLSALLLLPGALAQAADFFDHAVINLPMSRSRPAKPWHRVLSTQAEWEGFYREHAGAAVEVPSIDFTRYRVVAGGLDLQPMSTSLSVQSVGDAGNMIYVDVLVASPEPPCGTLDGMGYPTLAVVIAQSAKPVTVTARRAAYACGEPASR